MVVYFLTQTSSQGPVGLERYPYFASYQGVRLTELSPALPRVGKTSVSVSVLYLFRQKSYD